MLNYGKKLALENINENTYAIRYSSRYYKTDSERNYNIQVRLLKFIDLHNCKHYRWLYTIAYIQGNKVFVSMKTKFIF